MKIKYTKVLKDGRRHVLVELRPGEGMPSPAIEETAFYRLAYPPDDVVQGHHIKNLEKVYWDPLSQGWSV